MVAKKRALGRGLDALLGLGAEQIAASEVNGDLLKTLPIDLIRRGRYQPRLDIKAETLQELAASIKAQGVVQPIVVKPASEPGHYELIAGERRWRASQIAGLNTIPCIVKNIAEAQAMAIALIENIQREQLNPLEEATALERLIKEFNMTHLQVAAAIGRSRAAVSNLLRLLDLEPAVKKLLESGDLEMGHARALSSLSGNAQEAAAHKVVVDGLSVRQTEQLVRDSKGQQKPTTKAAPREIDPNIRNLEESLAMQLGAKVVIKHKSGGKGTLAISYNSLDELDGILAHIK
ncbi:MAG: ParB/RepB/Spo0J family partition protein [Pseudomonadota bacterium]